MQIFVDIGQTGWNRQRFKIFVKLSKIGNVELFLVQSDATRAFPLLVSRICDVLPLLLITKYQIIFDENTSQKMKIDDFFIIK